MRKLFTLVLLAGAFCGGYQVGRQPGAPDLAPLAKKCYAVAHDVSGRLAEWASAQWEELNAASTDPALADGRGETASQEQ